MMMKKNVSNEIKNIFKLLIIADVVNHAYMFGRFDLSLRYRMS